MFAGGVHEIIGVSLTGDRHRGGGAVVVVGVGRREGDRERMATGSEDRSGPGRVRKRPGHRRALHRRARIQLRRAKRRAGNDGRRRRPRDHRSRFRDDDRNHLRRGDEVGRVGRRERDRERMGAGGEDCSGPGRVHKRPGHAPCPARSHSTASRRAECRRRCSPAGSR